MYNSIFCYLTAFAIVATAQSSAHDFDGPYGHLAATLVILASWGWMRLKFRAIARSAASSPSVAAYWRPRFQGLTQKFQVGLLAPFALLLFTTPYLSSFSAGPANESDLLSTLAGLAPYLALQLLLWWEAYGLKKLLLGEDASRLAFLATNAKMEFSMIGPWMIVALLGDALRLAFPSLYEAIESNSLAAFVYPLVFLLVAAIFLPVAVTKLWGAKPIPEGAERERLKAVSEKMGLKVREIMLWTLMGGRAMTAGIIGLVPRFRYLLVTPALLEALDEDEVAGVVAHEAGHVKHRHLWFYIIFFTGLFASAISLLYDAVSLAAIWGQMAHPETLTRENAGSYAAFATSALTIVFVIIGFRFIFGAISRNFERQADLYSLQVMGSPLPIQSALLKISAHSGDLRDIPSWHHGSISERVAFLQEAFSQPDSAQAHEKKIRKIKNLLWAGLLAATTLAAAAKIPVVAGWLYFTATKTGIESYMSRNPDEAGPLMALGMLYYEDGQDEKGVGELYRAAEMDPQNPYVQNALAWVLAKSQNPAVKNCAEAVSHAEAACLILPLPSFLDTLAEAHWCAGETEEARKTIEIALEFAKNSGAEDEIPYLERQKERFSAENLP